MKKTILRILVLVMVLNLGTAAAGSPMPEIPAFQGTLNIRPVSSETEALAYAKEIWALDYLGMDFPIGTWEAERYEEDCWVVYALDGPEEGDYCYGDVIFDLEGNVVRVENAASGVFEVLNEAGVLETEYDAETEDPYDSDEWAAWRDMLDRTVEYPFLEKFCPAVYAEYTALYPVEEGGINEFFGHYDGTYTDSYNSGNVFDVYYSEPYRDGTLSIQFAVQISPVVRVVFFDIQADAEEGGSG